MPRDPSFRASDEPTRALPSTPGAPVPPPPVRERVVADAPLIDVGVLERLHESVRTLRVLVAGLALLTIAALVLAVIALQSDDEGDSTSGASRARVERVDDRVSRLKRQVQDLRSESTSGASTNDVTALRRQVAAAAKASDVEALRTAVSQVKADQGSSDGAVDPQPALDALGERIDDLEAQLRQTQEAQSAP